jgi:type II secretory pathway component PulM
MSDFLAQYSMREKLVVGLALLIITIVGTHALLIEPYQQRVAVLEQEITQRQEDLAWMKSVIVRMPVTSTTTGTEEISGSLVNFIDQVVRKQGLSGQLSQMSPIGNDEIRMRYSAIDFNQLVNFIAQVNTRGLKIKDIRISAADNPGIVDSNIVLVRR